MSIEKIIEILRSQDELFERYEGCSGKEISSIEFEAGGKLPDIYKIFLAKMGKNAGNYMLGSSAFYDDLPDLKQAALELLEENHFEKELPAKAFIFWVHQGYQIAFFIMGISENPPVFYYGEGEELKQFKEMGTLTDFFELQLRLSGFEF